MKFTEAQLELAIIELLGVEGDQQVLRSQKAAKAKYKDLEHAQRTHFL
jgi:hypothetical protein